MDPNYKPSERQKNCRYSFPFSGKKMNQTSCMKKMDESDNSDSEVYVTNADCESCECYNSRYPGAWSRSNHVQKNMMEKHTLACILVICRG